MQLTGLFIALRSSLWFVPALCIVAAIALGAGLVYADARLPFELAARWPMIFGGGPEGTRGMLEAIATAVLSVAGISFSVTFVALSLASQQYSPRILRNFMRDAVNQWVLGAFVGIFTYCLIVLRSIRAGDAEFVPAVSVLVAFAFALLAVALFIVFIHHIADSMQASKMIETVTLQTRRAIDHQYGRPHRPESFASALRVEDPSRWRRVDLGVLGYIQSMNLPAIAKWAKSHGVEFKIEQGVGAFVGEGVPIVAVCGDVDEVKMRRMLRRNIVVGHFRTVAQDVEFGFRQLVDMALKALSPSINDTSNAIGCLQYMGDLLNRLAGRAVSAQDDPAFFGTLHFAARQPSFERYVDLTFDEILRFASDNPPVLYCMLAVLESLFENAPADRHGILRKWVVRVREAAERNLQEPEDRLGLQVRAAWVLAGTAQPQIH